MRGRIYSQVSRGGFGYTVQIDKMESLPIWLNEAEKAECLRLIAQQNMTT